MSHKLSASDRLSVEVLRSTRDKSEDTKERMLLPGEWARVTEGEGFAPRNTGIYIHSVYMNYSVVMNIVVNTLKLQFFIRSLFHDAVGSSFHA
jgi:hypothetical protein